MDVLDNEQHEIELQLKTCRIRINRARIILFCVMGFWATTGVFSLMQHATVFTWVSEGSLLLFLTVNLFVYKRPFLFMLLLTIYVFVDEVFSLFVIIFVSKLNLIHLGIGQQSMLLGGIVLLRLLLIVMMASATFTAKKYEHLKLVIKEQTVEF